MKMKTFISILLFLTAQFVMAQQKPPVALDDSVMAYAGTKLYINVLENDYWMEGHYCRIYAVSIPNTNVTYNDSLIIYDTQGDEYGIKRIQYILEDTNNMTYSEVAMLKVNFINNAYNTLNTGRLHASFNARGNHHGQTDFKGSGDFLCYDDGNRRSLIKNMTLWIGARDESDNLHLAAETAWENGGNDFWMGPVSDDYNVSYVGTWSRLWKVTREDIEYHKSTWNDPFYIPPDALATWPGVAENHLRELEQLAPFIDYNQDGIYNPLDGDYPDIPGDEAMFFIYNDAAMKHASGGRKLGVEIRGMAYVYHRPANEALSNTIFVHYEILNRSDTVYHDTYLGIFADMAIGVEGDDYIACDILRNSFYGFNGDSIDGPADPAVSFGRHPPAVAVTILKGPRVTGNMERMSTFMAYHAEGQETYCEPPTFDDAYYQSMQGYWLDGQRMEFGGTGHPQSGAVGPYCRFAFPGDSDPYNLGTDGVLPNDGYNLDGKYWTEIHEQRPPHKISGLASMGPFTFGPGESEELDIAFVYGQDTANKGPDHAVTVLKARIDSIRHYFENNCFPGDDPPSAINETEVIDDILLYPNPCRDILRLQIPDSRFQTQDSRFQTQDSRFQTQDSRFQTQDSRFQTFLVEICDMSGRMIISKQIGNNAVDVSNLSPGLYLARIINGNNYFVKKFIVTH